MSEEAQSGDVGAGARGIAKGLTSIAFVIGGTALVVAMACDAAAVIGRHLGAPLLGSIEIVQSCIAIIASSAIVGATLDRAHAGVHILLERLHGASRALLQRFADLASAAFCTALLTGSAWLLWDLRGGHERTDILHLPVAALRFTWCVCVALAGAVFLVRAVRGARTEPSA